jgi:hypothetical protein
VQARFPPASGRGRTRAAPPSHTAAPLTQRRAPCWRTSPPLACRPSPHLTHVASPAARHLTSRMSPRLPPVTSRTNTSSPAPRHQQGPPSAISPCSVNETSRRTTYTSTPRPLHHNNASSLQACQLGRNARTTTMTSQPNQGRIHGTKYAGR